MNIMCIAGQWVIFGTLFPQFTFPIFSRLISFASYPSLNLPASVSSLSHLLPAPIILPPPPHLDPVTISQHWSLPFQYFSPKLLHSFLASHCTGYLPFMLSSWCRVITRNINLSCTFTKVVWFIELLQQLVFFLLCIPAPAVYYVRKNTTYCTNIQESRIRSAEEQERGESIMDTAVMHHVLPQNPIYSLPLE